MRHDRSWHRDRWDIIRRDNGTRLGHYNLAETVETYQLDRLVSRWNGAVILVNDRTGEIFAQGLRGPVGAW